MLNRIEKILLFLVLLFLPTQLGKHFWPEFSFVYSLPIDYLSPAVYFWDLLVMGLMLTWILSKPKINKLALNLFLFFLLTQTLSFWGAQNMGAGLVRLEQYGISGLLGVYVASQKWNFLKSQLFYPLALGILFESGLAIAQFLKGGTLGFWILGERSFSITTPGIAKFNFYGLEFLRPYATFPHPNVLAGYLIGALLLISKLKTQNLKLLVMVGGIIIVLTMSRVAILAGFVLLLLLFRKNMKFIIVITIIIILLSPILLTRFSALLSYDQLTLLRREELTTASWNLFLKSPLLGVGLNNFISSQQDLVAGPSRFLQPVHNIFLLSLSETGIIGFLGLIILFYPVLKLYPIPYTLYAILFLGLFDHYFLTLPQGYRLLFMLWGLSLSKLSSKII